ncbi:MAG: hypothetical protein J0H29_01400 [Sphingobacteriales bacterium]|nr:hypothetical protein [Sphingobacteriales bacterium]OJY89318.1 MAG: hypothetical protein BGP14_05285 [Sphingobacteriales bacterium 44-15]
MRKKISSNSNTQLVQSSGTWGVGKVDVNNPSVKKGIVAAKELKAQIFIQQNLNVESLKRMIRL